MARFRSRSRDSPGLLEGERFTAFYRSSSDGLLAWFARRVFDPETALDLTAETFAQAFLSKGRFRGTGDDAARAWLYGIARHQLSHFHRGGSAERRARARLGISVPDLSAGDFERIEDLAESEALRRAVRDGLAALSSAEAEAVRARVVEEMAYSELAERFAISEVAARARVSRGLRALARSIEPKTPATADEVSR